MSKWTLGQIANITDCEYNAGTRTMRDPTYGREIQETIGGDYEVNSDIANGLVKEIQVLDDKQKAYFKMDSKTLKAEKGKIITAREDNPDNNDLDMIISEVPSRYSKPQIYRLF